MDEIVKDKRFAHIAKDPRFKNLPRNEQKFKVDKRFKNMFSDKKFKLKYSVDKRGRKVNLTTNDNLKKFYDLNDDEDDESDEDENKKEEKPVVKENEKKNDENSENKDKKKDRIVKKDENEDEDDDKDVKKDDEDEEDDDDEDKSSEEEESDEGEGDDEPNEEEFVPEIPWSEMDKEAERNEDESYRLAICNMDWDRISCKDLFVLLNSFKPSNGSIKSIKKYLSEYGAQRMKEEEMHGPIELREGETEVLNDDHDDNKPIDFNDDDEEGDSFDRRKLRQYQFNRLKYYYAIVECDSVATASKIYSECDGMEYESSCTRLDLRFVPDDTKFDENPVDECTESPDPTLYKPNLFFTTALNQTKVECTWDETPRERILLTKKKYSKDEANDIEKYDYKKIIASESEDEADEKEDEKDERKDDRGDSIQLFKQLIAKTNKNRRDDLEMEIMWDSGIGGGSSGAKDDDDNLVSDNEDDDEDGYNRLFNGSKNAKKKKKTNKHKEVDEKQANEDAQLDLLTIGDTEKEHFNYDDFVKSGKKKFKGKKKGEEETTNDNFKFDYEDQRFAALFTNHNYNIDPSNQLFKKTSVMDGIVNNKLKRKKK